MINNYLERQIKENFPYQPTPEQEIAVKSLSEFLLSPRSEVVFMLRGYAGTGKTSLVGALVRTLDKLQQKSVLLAPTGRAAKVFSAYAGHPAFTIHKKIYRQQSFSNEVSNFSVNDNLTTHTLYIVDEASMISNEGLSGAVFGTGRLLKSATADTEHVLLAILKDGDNLAATVLEEHRVDYQAVFEQLSMKSTNPNAGMGFTEDDEEDEEDMNMSRSSRTGGAGSASAAQAASRKPSNDTPVLDNFGVDMTRAAEEGKLDPVVGREREIERLAQILSRRKKNNPVLIGEPGVGKSAIVEGLALRIVQKKVSRILFEKRVVKSSVLELPLSMNTERISRKTVLWNVVSKR